MTVQARNAARIVRAGCPGRARSSTAKCPRTGACATAAKTEWSSASKARAWAARMTHSAPRVRAPLKHLIDVGFPIRDINPLDPGPRRRPDRQAGRPARRLARPPQPSRFAFLLSLQGHLGPAPAVLARQSQTVTVGTWSRSQPATRKARVLCTKNPRPPGR